MTIPKFRAWDTLNKKMRQVSKIAWDLKDPTYLCIYDENGNDWDIDQIVLMQAIGLRDKNDIEIFQGDIIKAFLDDKRGYAVGCVWYLAPLWFLANYTTGKREGSYEMSLWGCGVIIDEFEILGNKHQHPELLQGNIMSNIKLVKP